MAARGGGALQQPVASSPGLCTSSLEKDSPSGRGGRVYSGPSAGGEEGVGGGPMGSKGAVLLLQGREGAI